MNRGPCPGLGSLLWCRGLCVPLLLALCFLPSVATAQKRTNSSSRAGLLPDPPFPPFNPSMWSSGDRRWHTNVPPTPSWPNNVRRTIQPSALLLRRTAEPSILRLASKGSVFLQVFPNGTVSGTMQEDNIFSVLERVAVSVGFVYLRGIASHQFVCLNRCGLLYGSRNLTDDCVFRESIEKNWYNTYTSKNHSSRRKNLFMALNRSGNPCRLNLNTTLSAQGHVSTHLGSNENFALFSPIRNITLPPDTTIASLYEIGHNYGLKQLNKTIDAFGAGCAPQCNRVAVKEHPRHRCRHKRCGQRRRKQKQDHKKAKRKKKNKDKSDKKQFNTAVKVRQRHRSSSSRRRTSTETLPRS